MIFPTSSFVEGAQRVEAIGEDTAISGGTQVVASATVHTKGAWAQLVASSLFAADGIAILVPVFGTLVGRALMDIGVGAASSEQVVIPNIYFEGVTTQRGSHYSFPIRIPAGSRVSARAQSSAVSSALFTVAHLFQGGWRSPRGLSRVIDYGTNTGDTGGVQVDPGATINTKGAWSEIISSTTARIKHLTISVGGQGNAVRTGTHHLTDIGIGAAGSEQVLIPDIYFWQEDVSDSFNMGSRSFPCDIPEGTRIAARGQCGINDATDRLFDLMVYGAD